MAERFFISGMLDFTTKKTVVYLEVMKNGGR